MYSNRPATSARPFLLPLICFAFALGACDSSPNHGTTDGATPLNDYQLSDGFKLSDGGILYYDAALECQGDKDCNGGVCLAGSCCPSSEQACGDVCCSSGSVCFANACVVPGKSCTSDNDCGENEYCEPALGEGNADGGVAPPDLGQNCISTEAKSGRCLELPPRCPPGQPAPDGGADGTGCLSECEYHPPAGLLQVTQKWSWGSKTVKEFPDSIDVWSTPAVGRLADSNCDGTIDRLDPPNIIFVSGNSNGTCCQCGPTQPSACKTGVLRVLHGATGQELWSLEKPEASSIGFAGLSIAIGDIIGDSRMEIVAASGEGFVYVIDNAGVVLAKSDLPIPQFAPKSFGWGGGLALADQNGDGNVEIAYAATVFTVSGSTVTRQWTGSGGTAGGGDRALSLFADLDLAANGQQELVVGRAAIKTDGSQLWSRPDLPDGFPAVGDFDGDGKPDVVLVGGKEVWILKGADGTTLFGPVSLPGKNQAGPPTVADFDGDGKAEIGVAQDNFYSLIKPKVGTQEIELLWKAPNHDFSSSVTGSTVFDFEGDGSAEVIYNDECFLWVYGGKTGEVLFATPTTSFTATEASLVADVDGDGHAEIVMVSNGANPQAGGTWPCMDPEWLLADGVRPGWTPPPGETVYRGITVFGDKANSWVGTRTLWNQHTYHVSNICDDHDSACDTPNTYGSIPKKEKSNWTLPWLNNFRQNVQDQGIFNAPDGILSLSVDCVDPYVLRAALRNNGLAILPAGVAVGFYHRDGTDQLLGTVTTTTPLFPGQAMEVTFETSAQSGLDKNDIFVAKIVLDTNNPLFHECREDNNVSNEAQYPCDIIK